MHLLTGKHTLTRLLCYGNPPLRSKTAPLHQAERSDGVGGLTASPAQNFWSDQIQPQETCSVEEKDRPLLPHNKMKDRKSWALPVQAGRMERFWRLIARGDNEFSSVLRKKNSSFILLLKRSCICVMEMPI